MHPPLIAVSWVLAAFFASEVHPLAAVRSVIVAGLFAVTVYACLRLAVRQRELAGTIASLIVLALISSPLLAAVLRIPTWGLLGLTPLASLGVIGTRLLGRRRKMRRDWYVRATPGFNVFAALLLGVVFMSAATNGSLATAYRDLASYPRTAASDADASHPDIYLILLDGYARADTLKKSYDYDNDAFLTALSDRELAMATGSRANYMRTHLTLVTMFEMAYLESFIERMPTLSPRSSAATMTRAINESPGARLLRREGYKIVALAPGYEQTALRSTADTFLDSGSLNEFEIALLRLSFLKDLIEFAAPDFPSAQQRHRVEWNLRTMVELAGERSHRPRLVFGHIPSPHTPIVYGPNGEPMHATQLDDFFEDRSAGQREYAGQIEHLNSLVLKTIDGILENASSPPIIIVFSDHGPGEFEMDLADIDRSATATRLRTLFAAYTPGHQDLFDDATTPVNLLSSLANAYFDTAYALVPGRFYASGPDSSLAEIPDPDDRSTFDE